MKKSLIALALLACAGMAMAFAPFEGKAPPGSSIAQAIHKTSAEQAAPATTQSGAVHTLAASACDATTYLNGGGKAPSKPVAPGKSGGGKKKCLTAATGGEDSAPGEPGDDAGTPPTSARRILRT